MSVELGLEKDAGEQLTLVGNTEEPLIDKEKKLEQTFNYMLSLAQTIAEARDSLGLMLSVMAQDSEAARWLAHKMATQAVEYAGTSPNLYVLTDVMDTQIKEELDYSRRGDGSVPESALEALRARYSSEYTTISGADHYMPGDITGSVVETPRQASSLGSFAVSL